MTDSDGIFIHFHPLFSSVNSIVVCYTNLKFWEKQIITLAN